MTLFFLKKKRGLFSEELKSGSLKCGTSVWHSYAHVRSCQLLYNPRLNDDWGLSDGEALERVWSWLSFLVAQLRYSTKEHRLTSINLQGLVYNEALLWKAGKNLNMFEFSPSFIYTPEFTILNFDPAYLLNQRMKEVNKLLTTSKLELDELFLAKDTYSLEYFKTQWLRQRDCQLQITVSDNTKSLTTKLAQLVELEEQFHQIQ